MLTNQQITCDYVPITIGFASVSALITFTYAMPKVNTALNVTLTFYWNLSYSSLLFLEYEC